LNGDVWAWGVNDIGQLGDGTRADRSIPTRVLLPEPARAIGAGGWSSFAVLNNGNLYAWGYDGVGPLRTGFPDPASGRDRPVPLATPQRIVIAAGGDYHFVMQTLDGILLGGGSNGRGQLGQGKGSAEALPVRIVPLDPISLVASGGGHVLALRPSIARLGVSPASLDFGEHIVRRGSALLTATLINPGPQPLTILGMHIHGAAAADYAVSLVVGGPTLAAEQRCSVTVRFRPRGYGERWATLRVWHSRSVMPFDIPLMGTGILWFWWFWSRILEWLRFPIRAKR
jgi:hypothetical protein